MDNSGTACDKISFPPLSQFVSVDEHFVGKTADGSEFYLFNHPNRDQVPNLITTSVTSSPSEEGLWPV